MLRTILQRAVKRLGVALDPPPSDTIGSWTVAPAKASPASPSISDPLEVVTRDLPGCEPAEVRLQRQLVERDEEIRRLRRQLSEYWIVIRRFEQQRDQWRELFKEKTRRYQSLVSKLNDTLAEERQMLVRALHAVNTYRREKEQPPIDQRTYDEALAKLDPARPDLQSARVYCEELKKAYEEAPTLLRRDDFHPPVLEPSVPALQHDGDHHEGS